jgi:methylthioribose-1-phosphate isomerase
MLVNKIGRVMKAVFSNEYGYKFIVLISFELVGFGL